MYLLAIIDWYSRYVVSWKMNQALEIDSVLEAVKKAFSKSKPVILKLIKIAISLALNYTVLVLEDGNKT